MKSILALSLAVAIAIALPGGSSCACGVSTLSSPSPTESSTAVFKAVDAATTFIVEGAVTTLGSILGNVVGFIVTPLINVAEIQAEDPSFLPNVHRGVEQIKAQVALGDYSSCGSCAKAGADLQDLLK